MPDITIKPEERLPEPPPKPLRERLLWFVGLYIAGAVVTAAIAYGLRALMLM